MKRICWWLTDLFSRTLESSEREAVRGDLIECGVSGSQALREVVGLVARRQIAQWSDWRLWLTLLGILLPVGMLLSIVSRDLLGISSVYAWLYFQNWSSHLLETRGFWYVLGDSARDVLRRSLDAACLSWSAGFLVGRCIRLCKPRLMGFLLCVMLLFGASEGVPAYLGFLARGVHRVVPVRPEHDPIRALIFYSTILPLITLVIFVALPALWGMHEARKARTVRTVMGKLALGAAWASLVLAVLLVPGLVFLILLNAGMRPETWHGWSGSLKSFIGVLRVAIYWPLAYLLASLVSRRRRTREALTAS